MKCKHDYKQTGTVAIPTGKMLVKSQGELMSIPLTNIDSYLHEIKKECLVFICNKCEKLIVKEIGALESEDK